MHITTLGVDLAKSVFPLHGVDADGEIVLKRKVRRGALLETLSKLAPCLVDMKACVTCHY
jgi:transposase